MAADCIDCAGWQEVTRALVEELAAVRLALLNAETARDVAHFECAGGFQ